MVVLPIGEYRKIYTVEMLQSSFPTYISPSCGGGVISWLAYRTADLEFGGLSLVSAIMLFPQKGSFIQHCLSSPSGINGYK